MADYQAALVEVPASLTPLDLATLIGLPETRTLGASAQMTLVTTIAMEELIRAGRLYWRLTLYGTSHCFAVTGTDPTASGSLGLAYCAGMTHHIKAKLYKTWSGDVGTFVAEKLAVALAS